MLIFLCLSFAFSGVGAIHRFKAARKAYDSPKVRAEHFATALINTAWAGWALYLALTYQGA